jgi:hypothetical protein
MNEARHTRVTTIGGTLTILLANINSADIVKTAVLAAVGAAVSFVMSHVLKKVARWMKRPQP